MLICFKFLTKIFYFSYNKITELIIENSLLIGTIDIQILSTFQTLVKNECAKLWTKNKL